MNPVNTIGTVLAVDDDPMIGRSLERILSRANLTLIRSRTPEDALDILEARSREIGLVISDYSLGSGHMNGVQLLDKISKLYPGVRKILSSGTHETLLPEHPYVFLKKPVNPADLLAAVKEQLGYHT